PDMDHILLDGKRQMLLQLRPELLIRVSIRTEDLGWFRARRRDLPDSYGRRRGGCGGDGDVGWIGCPGQENRLIGLLGRNLSDGLPASLKCVFDRCAACQALVKISRELDRRGVVNHILDSDYRSNARRNRLGELR